MAEKLQYGVEVETGKAEEQVKSFKQQLKEANAEVIKMAEKFGVTSKEAVEAAKKTAELKDKIGDAKNLVDAFNPDAKFKALSMSLSGVAGGFSAIQGGMALFGSESENLTKTLVKVQSAMALSQGLQAVGESIDSFKQLGAVISSQVVRAFSTLKSAIISTGIGALAVAIGVVIANFDELSQWVAKTFPNLKAFGDKIAQIITKITDYIGITSQASREADAWTKAIGKITKALDNQINELEAQGGRENEVYKLKKDRLQAQLDAIRGASDKELETKADLNSQLRVLELNEKKRLTEKWKQDKADKDAYDNWLLSEEIRKREEASAKLKKKMGDIGMIGADGLTEKQREALRKDQEERDAKWKIKADKRMEEMAKGAFAKKMEAKGKEDAIELQNAQDVVDAKKHIDELEKENKIATVGAIGDIVAGLSSIIGQDTAVGKGIAVASATIDTYQSASTIFKQASKNPITTINPAYPYLMAAPAVLSGIARVKQIASVQIPNQGGGNSAPSVSTASPVSPVVPTASTTNISQDSINALGNQAIKAYVVESDVTSSQKRIEAIRQRARFN